MTEQEDATGHRKVLVAITFTGAADWELANVHVEFSAGFPRVSLGFGGLALDNLGPPLAGSLWGEGHRFAVPGDLWDPWWAAWVPLPPFQVPLGSHWPSFVIVFCCPGIPVGSPWAPWEAFGHRLDWIANWSRKSARNIAK